MFDRIVKFYARGDAQMPCPHGAEASPQRRAWVGRKHKQVAPGQWALVPNDFGDPYTAKYHHDLRKACRDGDLWAADEETARICGVVWDPSFGGVIDPKTGKPPAAAGAPVAPPAPVPATPAT